MEYLDMSVRVLVLLNLFGIAFNSQAAPLRLRN